MNRGQIARVAAVICYLGVLICSAAAMALGGAVR